jgi:hypothetical protein
MYGRGDKTAYIQIYKSMHMAVGYLDDMHDGLDQQLK